MFERIRGIFLNRRIGKLRFTVETKHRFETDDPCHKRTSSQTFKSRFFQPKVMKTQTFCTFSQSHFFRSLGCHGRNNEKLIKIIRRPSFRRRQKTLNAAQNNVFQRSNIF